MKIKTDKTKKSILRAAEKEFLKKGFRSALLRDIAKNANGTTGVIYTYFKNKDELFNHLVQPVIIILEGKLVTNVLSIQEAKEETGMDPKGWFTQNLKFLIDLIEKYPNEMKLLFLKSEGSSLQNYKERLIEKGTRRSITAFRTLKRSKEFEGEEISEFFVTNLVMYIINIVVEIIRQNKNRKEVPYYEKEITSFLFSGWKALVKM
ncbi:MAG: TetR/AcrR family transcriptional regulator [Thermodesulfobacteriota bacterium]|nr:TetR/AcrR family transcriptional regulator [Thermodesulfobacteriota bacterium]